MIEALGNLGDFIGGIAVVATLVYLAMQIRANTKAMRMASVQSLMAYSMNANIASVAPRIPAILAKLLRGDRLDDEERVLYRYQVQMVLTSQWQVFHQHANGMIEDAFLKAWEHRNHAFWGMPEFREYWPALRPGYTPDFQVYMDAVLERATSEPR